MKTVRITSLESENSQRLLGAKYNVVNAKPPVYAFQEAEDFWVSQRGGESWNKKLQTNTLHYGD